MIGELVKDQTDHEPEVVQRDTYNSNLLSSGLDQYSREIMHVRQSITSKVSSFDVMTGQLVRLLVMSK